MYYHIKDEKNGYMLIRNNNHGSVQSIQDWLQEYSSKLNLVLDLCSEIWQVWYFPNDKKPEKLFDLWQRLSPHQIGYIKNEVKRRDRKRNAKELDKEFDYYMQDGYDNERERLIKNNLEEQRYVMKQRLAWRNGCVFLEGRD